MVTYTVDMFETKIQRERQLEFGTWKLEPLNF
jgi:hypothetical protein